MKIHELKIHRGPFAAIVAGVKPWELRRNDRDFTVGDVLKLREWQPSRSPCEPARYTGRQILCEIVWMMDGGPLDDHEDHPFTALRFALTGDTQDYGLPNGFCIMTIRPWTPRALCGGPPPLPRSSRKPAVRTVAGRGRRGRW